MPYDYIRPVKVCAVKVMTMPVKVSPMEVVAMMMLGLELRGWKGDRAPIHPWKRSGDAHIRFLVPGWVRVLLVPRCPVIMAFNAKAAPRWHIVALMAA